MEQQRLRGGLWLSAFHRSVVLLRIDPSRANSTAVASLWLSSTCQEVLESYNTNEEVLESYNTNESKCDMTRSSGSACRKCLLLTLSQRVGALTPKTGETER